MTMPNERPSPRRERAQIEGRGPDRAGTLLPNFSQPLSELPNITGMKLNARPVESSVLSNKRIAEGEGVDRIEHRDALFADEPARLGDGEKVVLISHGVLAKQLAARSSEVDVMFLRQNELVDLVSQLRRQPLEW